MDLLDAPGGDAEIFPDGHIRKALSKLPVLTQTLEETRSLEEADSSNKHQNIGGRFRRIRATLLSVGRYRDEEQKDCEQAIRAHVFHNCGALLGVLASSVLRSSSLQAWNFTDRATNSIFRCN